MSDWTLVICNELNKMNKTMDSISKSLERISASRGQNPQPYNTVSSGPYYHNGLNSRTYILPPNLPR